jgi:predicted DNA binding CopG/RHH family protein
MAAANGREVSDCPSRRNTGGPAWMKTSMLCSRQLFQVEKRRGNTFKGRAKAMKLDPGEKAILESVENCEWRSVRGQKQERKRYAGYAAATFRKDKRVNIRISGKDLEALQKRALEEGLPYQTLISSLIHKFVSGRLQGV